GHTISGVGIFSNNAALSTRGAITCAVANFATISAQSGDLILGRFAVVVFNGSTGLLQNLVGSNLFIDSSIVNNLGSVTVNAGGSVAFNNAALDMPAGETCALRGGVLGTVQLTVNSGATLNGYGQLTGNLVNSSAAVDFYGPMIVEGNLINNSGGTILVRSAQTE